MTTLALFAIVCLIGAGCVAVAYVAVFLGKQKRQLHHALATDVNNAFASHDWTPDLSAKVLTFEKQLAGRHVSLVIRGPNPQEARHFYLISHLEPREKEYKLGFQFRPSSQKLERPGVAKNEPRVELYNEKNRCAVEMGGRTTHHNAKVVHAHCFGEDTFPLDTDPPFDLKEVTATQERVCFDCSWRIHLYDLTQQDTDRWFEEFEAMAMRLFEAYSWTNIQPHELAEVLLDHDPKQDVKEHLTVVYAGGMESEECQQYCGDLIMDSATSMTLRGALLEMLINLPGGCNTFADRVWTKGTPERRFKLFHHHPYGFYGKLVRPQERIAWLEEVLELTGSNPSKLEEIIALVDLETLASEDLSAQARAKIILIASKRWLDAQQIALVAEMAKHLDGDPLSRVVEQFDSIKSSNAPGVVATAMTVAGKFDTPDAKYCMARVVSRHAKAQQALLNTAEARAFLHAILETPNEARTCALALTALEWIGDKSTLILLSKIARDPRPANDLPGDATTRTLSKIIDRHGADLDLEGQLSLANREQGGELTMSKEGGSISVVDP